MMTSETKSEKSTAVAGEMPAIAADESSTPKLCTGADDATDVDLVTIEEIISHASIFSKIMSDGCSEIPKSEVDAHFEQITRIFQAGMFQVLFAARALIEGRPFKLVSDNPQTIVHIQSLAERMGATIELFADGWLTKIVLAPPSRQ